VTIKEVRFAKGTEQFEIVAPTIPPTITLKKGESIKIQVRIKPTIENKIYEDSLRVILGCTEVKVKVYAETVRPCIYVGDLNFGTLSPGDSVTKDLAICNQEYGYISFNNPTGDAVITWLDNNFSITDADKQKLKQTVLGPKDNSDPSAPACVTIKVTFSSMTTGSFQTTAQLWESTTCHRDTSVWKAVVTQPGPQITGYDWKEQWVTISNECTKNTAIEYDALIKISNDGDQPFKVRRLELVGADAEYFELDTVSNVNTSVKYGQEIRPGAADARDQRVIFRPKDERNYSVIVRLTTEDGVVVESFLEGIGIESHISITGNDFGSVQFVGAGATTVNGTAMLKIRPTRPTTITDLQINGADAGSFRFAPAPWPTAGYTDRPTPAAPWNAIPTGTDIEIPIIFAPNTPGNKVAAIEAFGDFAKCDTSIAPLLGHSYTLTAAVTDVPFPRTLTCDTEDSAAFLTNTGSAPIKVKVKQGGFLDQTNGFFEFPTSATAQQQWDTLEGGESYRVPVTFKPGATGTFNARIIFEVWNLDETVQIGEYTSNISGEGFTIQVNAHIDDQEPAFPGSRIDIPVILDGALDEADVDKLSFSITYEAGMMLLQNGNMDQINTMLAGTLLEGWSALITDSKDGEFAVTLTAPAGQTLKGTGELLMLKFLTFVGNAKSSELKFDITLDNRPCATVVTDPGSIELQEICGLDFRLIEAFGKTYALNQNAPNPFNPSTSIIFSVGLDAQTSLSIYNASGEKVAVLVDQYLQPGTYTVTWDATAHPSGMYYYRLESGHWSKTETMILRK
jgi:hypothetical protein